MSIEIQIDGNILTEKQFEHIIEMYMKAKRKNKPVHRIFKHAYEDDDIEYGLCTVSSESPNTIRNTDED